MRHSPSPALSDSQPTPLHSGEEAALRLEIGRLRRENRALSIALAEMERVAERDMLTPLFNRRYFLSALHQRLARVERSGDRIVLIFIDVDRLKGINDRYGHAAGDFALVEIATRLTGMMREMDILARIGGDEFGILLDNIALSEGRAKIRRLAAAIEDEPCLYDGHSISLSAAFGITTITPGVSAEELLGRADAEMYRAKRTA